MNMQSNTIRKLGLSISFVLGGIDLASVNSAQAATTTAPSATVPTTTPQVTTVTTSAHSGLIQSLHHAHSLLVHADHDYDGFRAKAAEEVHKALIDLGYHHKKSTSPTTVTNGTVTKPSTAVVASGHGKLHEPQGKSDAQLRQALQILVGAQSALNGKHPKAAANVSAAISNINTALAHK
jgi:hypothetical protein